VVLPPLSPTRFVTSAFDALAANVAVLDASGEILAVNRAWESFARQNGGGNDLGSNYLAICEQATGADRADALAVAGGIRQVLSRDNDLFELEYPCHSLTERRYFVARVTAFQQDGRRYAVVAHEDVTRRKLAELEVREVNRSLELRVEERTRLLAQKNEELEHRNHELAQFAHMASHDLQEPLRMISLQADLLQHRHLKDLSDERARRSVRQIFEQATRARQLVRDVMAISSLIPSHVTEPLDLETLWNEARETLPWPDDARLISGRLPPVQADPAQLRQVMTNLLTNAIKFRSERPLEVKLSGVQVGARVHFALSDNGIGVAPEQTERVFRMFHRLHSRSAIEGNGIGLAICRKIIEMHGGRIWLETVPTGGTMVQFSLPAAQEAPRK